MPGLKDVIEQQMAVSKLKYVQRQVDENEIPLHLFPQARSIPAPTGTKGVATAFVEEANKVAGAVKGVEQVVAGIPKSSGKAVKSSF